MVSVRGQAAPGVFRGNRMGGGSGVRRRDGQHPDTRQAQPVSADQLRVGPAVLVLGRLAARRLHRTDRRIGLRYGRVWRTVRMFLSESPYCLMLDGRPGEAAVSLWSPRSYTDDDLQVELLTVKHFSFQTTGIKGASETCQTETAARW